MAFSDNVWWTRKARIQAEKRLLIKTNFAVSSVAVSIYIISAEQEDLAGISWIVYSVLVLSMSGFIASCL